MIHTLSSFHLKLSYFQKSQLQMFFFFFAINFFHNSNFNHQTPNTEIKKNVVKYIVYELYYF